MINNCGNSLPCGTALIRLENTLIREVLSVSFPEYLLKIKSFAMYRCSVDKKQLQCDLNMLRKWSENWQLHFHPDKCEILCVTHARDFTSYPYKLSGCTLQSVSEMVDLGVSLTSDLSWNTQTPGQL